MFTTFLTYFPYNEAPFLKEKPENIYLYIGEERTYSTVKPSNDTVDVKVESPKRFTKFAKITIDKGTWVTTFEIKPTSISHVGTYDIKVILTDSHNIVPAKESKNSFFVVVKQKATDKGVINVKEKKDKKKGSTF